MKRLLDTITSRSIVFLAAALALAALGLGIFRTLPVDVFPDIAVPRVVIQTECPGLTSEEVEQRVTVPLETAMNGIPSVSTIRSSSSGGLSFVWVDFDWGTDLVRARFDVFERLQRVRETLPREVEVEIAPTVSVTGEIMLVALTAEGVERRDARGESARLLELREMAEYELRPRLLAVKGIGEVAVMGGRLPECRVSVSPRRLAASGLSVDDIVEAVRDARTSAGAGYLADVGGDEEAVTAVPSASVVTVGLEPTVFVRDEHDPDRFLAVEVEPGGSGGGWTGVKGLPDDDDLEIVVEGAYELKIALAAEAGSAPAGHFHADGTFHTGSDE